jgi:hypothetical protein
MCAPLRLTLTLLVKCSVREFPEEAAMPGNCAPLAQSPHLLNPSVLPVRGVRS